MTLDEATERRLVAIEVRLERFEQWLQAIRRALWGESRRPKRPDEI